MHDRIAWSLNLGCWRGVHVRLHMFFLLFAACALLLNWRSVDPGGTPHIQGVLWFSLLTLLVSVILHEAGHVWLARYSGAEADQIVLGPLGGMLPALVDGDPESEFRVHLAGPAVNLAVCAACVPALLIAKVHVWGLLNPLAPHDLTTGATPEILLKLTFWINWCLLLVNLIPAFPLDGGYALRAAILTRWPLVGPQHASTIVARTAQILAVLLLVGALLWPFEDGQLLLPIRFALVMLAIFLFFSARHRHVMAEKDELGHMGGFEFSGNLAALEQDLEESGEVTSGPLRRWLDQRRQTRLRRQRELEVEEEHRVDEILTRLHESGLRSLSSEDRALLERVSARYRSRQQQ